METYGKVLLIAMPAFLVLVLFEKIYGIIKKKDFTPNMDMISSLSSGITNVIKSVLGLSVAIISYPFMLKHFSFFQVQSTIWVYIICFITLDFAGYWGHRWNHKINLFWNQHIIHHSSEEFNLPCALRQSISNVVEIFTFLMLPAAIFGVPEKVVVTIGPLHLFAQFWYHTRHIGKMGFLEHILVTPSHHRVHHAINKEYMDKNLSQIFIFWDKWFGTFQEELKDVPPVYGITRPARTWNPVKINFQHVWLLIKDAWRTSSWKDKLTLWFKPTGYRPSDVAAKYPVYKIEDVYYFEKYHTADNRQIRTWSWIQIAFTLLLISYFFANIAAINNMDFFTAVIGAKKISFSIYLYGLFVFLIVYAYTELMDGNKYAWCWELVKNLFGLYLLWHTKTWFGLADYFAPAVYILIAYFVISTVISIYFSLSKLQVTEKQIAI